jgi:hypothetical protein
VLFLDPMKRELNIVGGGITVCVIASGAAALFASGGFSQDPHVPDAATGHTIPLSIRGAGTVYLTPSEWHGIAIYWQLFYFFMALLAAFLAVILVFESYNAVLRRWRRAGSGSNLRRRNE